MKSSYEINHTTVFDEKALQREIIAKWGVYGAHNEVFTMIMEDLRKSKLKITELEAQLESERAKAKTSV